MLDLQLDRKIIGCDSQGIGIFLSMVLLSDQSPVILGLIRYDIGSNQEQAIRKILVTIIGVPGYPVSAALTGEIFIEPLLAKWLGRQSNNLPGSKQH